MAVAYPCRYPTSLCEGVEAGGLVLSSQCPSPGLAQSQSQSIYPLVPLPCRLTVNQCHHQHTTS